MTLSVIYSSLVQKNKHNLKRFTLKTPAFSRKRKLTLIHTIGHVLHLVASRNANGYEIGSQEYFSQLCRHRRRPTPAASRSSVCEARQKLSFRAFEFLFRSANLSKDAVPTNYRWKGHIVRAVDGTKVSLPASKEVLQTFPRRENQGQLEHYPFGILVTAVNVFTGQPNAVRLTGKNGSEREETLSMLDEFEQGDIVLLDRGLDGGRLWNRIEEKGQHYVGRVRASNGGTSAAVKWLLRSGQLDVVVERPWRNLSTQECGVIKMRLIRGRKLKNGQYLVLVTNLLDRKKYSRNDLLELYRKRWKVETHYYRTKSLLNLSQFHARSLNGIKQEIYANLLILSVTALAILQTRQSNFHRERGPAVVPNFKNAT